MRGRRLFEKLVTRRVSEFEARTQSFLANRLIGATRVQLQNA